MSIPTLKTTRHHARLAECKYAATVCLHISTGKSDTAAEQEAQPFTKPAAAKKKQGPREQAKAAAVDKENLPTAATAQSTDDAAVTQHAKASQPPEGPAQARCGECAACRNPRGKKGCLRNKAQREALAATT